MRPRNPVRPHRFSPWRENTPPAAGPSGPRGLFTAPPSCNTTPPATKNSSSSDVPAPAGAWPTTSPTSACMIMDSTTFPPTEIFSVSWWRDAFPPTPGNGISTNSPSNAPGPCRPRAGPRSPAAGATFILSTARTRSSPTPSAPCGRSPFPTPLVTCSWARRT